MLQSRRESVKSAGDSLASPPDGANQRLGLILSCRKLGSSGTQTRLREAEPVLSGPCTASLFAVHWSLSASLSGRRVPHGRGLFVDFVRKSFFHGGYSPCSINSRHTDLHISCSFPPYILFLRIFPHDFQTYFC